MDTDVGRLKDFFLTHVGHDKATSTRTNPNSRLGLGRGQVPWKEVKDVLSQTGRDSSTPVFVAKVVTSLTHTYYSFVP
eukprot:4430172-Pleurochrysis_carterae.AAC.1